MERKWVHLLYAVAGVALVYLLKQTTEWVWSYFGKPKPLIVYAASILVAGGTTWWASRNEEIFGLASECVTELGKVAWPTRQETTAATLVVIVTVIIASLFLGVFDATWAFVTGVLFN
jgi:preprotein translocase SecE subunit